MPTTNLQVQDRRQFLRIVTVGASAIGATLLIPNTGLRAADETEALLLSCMDYRLTDQTTRYMDKHGLKNKYDHIILAGAALGAITETFWDHVAVASDLHKIRKVIVLDHRDCGAYKVVLGEDFAKDPAKETAIHATQLRRLRTMIKEKYPALGVELLLMALDGKVQTIS